MRFASCRCAPAVVGVEVDDGHAKYSPTHFVEQKWSGLSISGTLQTA